MELPENKVYVKRTQKDYLLSFKLQVVEEIEKSVLSKRHAKLKFGVQGDSTVTNWLKKYGNFDLLILLSKTPEQKYLI